MIEQEIDIKTVKVEVAVRYEDEDIPYDFPLRHGDMWEAKIDIDTGKIIDWPEGKSGKLSMKVCDEGTYRLYDENGKLIKSHEGGYVPNRLIPGRYGDYIDLVINKNGLIENWYSMPQFTDFFGDDDN